MDFYIEGTTDHQKYATILKTVNSSFMYIVMSH
uniref:Uncharacterized protein n=1 Tax=Anguilla anguilla TaxID=7936 RepID=A0A0E9S2K0_ANGAN